MTGGPTIPNPDRTQLEDALRQTFTEYKNREDLAAGVTAYLDAVLQLPPGGKTSNYYVAVGTIVADMLDQDQPPDRVIREINKYIGR